VEGLVTDPFVERPIAPVVTRGLHPVVAPATMDRALPPNPVEIAPERIRRMRLRLNRTISVSSPPVNRQYKDTIEFATSRQCTDGQEYGGAKKYLTKK
jgi:hypothetical protein